MTKSKENANSTRLVGRIIISVHLEVACILFLLIYSFLALTMTEMGLLGVAAFILGSFLLIAVIVAIGKELNALGILNHGRDFMVYAVSGRAADRLCG